MRVPRMERAHAAQCVTDNDIFDNRRIFGDNLLALKALEQEFTGTVKCIFIDPHYNTGSAFTHYDDGAECSILFCTTTSSRTSSDPGPLRYHSGTLISFGQLREMTLNYAESTIYPFAKIRWRSLSYQQLTALMPDS
ncbi:MAG: hypothetical protein ACP5E5_14235 [Acidobacteriaceae bacterium]